MGNMSSTDRAMWKVAWLLSCTAGEIGKEECRAFKELCFASGGMEPGTPGANEFLEEVAADAENLRRLKIFYTPEEQIRAFIAKVAPECDKLKADPVVSRKAFAVWVGMCMVDREYTETEKKLIRILRGVFSPSFKLTTAQTAAQTVAQMATIMFCPTVAIAGVLGKALKSKMSNGQDGNVITDGFLEELEDDLRMLADLKSQIDSATDGKQKDDLQKSYSYIEQSLGELIANGQIE